MRSPLYTSIIILLALGGARAYAGDPGKDTKVADAEKAGAPLLLDPPPRRLARGAGAQALNMGSFVKLASRLGPSVVNLMVTRRADGEDGARRGREQGTGFIVNRDGYILTNHHVVRAAEEIRVRLHDERELPGQLIGLDARTDLALVKIDPGSDKLSAAPLGDSDELKIGEWVMAIGNPFGLDHTVTVGIVSAKGRRDVHPGGAEGFFDFIQTDASINPGNSGGPLINTRGEVIGINTAINVAGSGIGFAIPINIARVIAKKIHESGRAQRSWLGVYPQQITESLRRAFGLKDRRGALVAEVVEGSPAQEAGVLSGDVIVEFDGKKVSRADDLMWLVAVTEPRPVPLVILREGARRQLQATLQEAQPDEPPPAPRAVPDKPSALGMAVSELTPQLARQIRYGEGRGVIVMLVEPGSPAMDAGVERGDIILQANGRPITTLEEYASVMGKIPRGEMIRLLVRREERKLWRNTWLAFVKR